MPDSIKPRRIEYATIDVAVARHILGHLKAPYPHDPDMVQWVAEEVCRHRMVHGDAELPVHSAEV